MNDWEPDILTRDDLFLPHADLEAWRKKHPRVHKRHPHFLVDFEDAGCYHRGKHILVDGEYVDNPDFDERYHCPWHFSNVRTIVLERDNNLCRVCGSDGSDCKKVAWRYQKYEIWFYEDGDQVWVNLDEYETHYTSGLEVRHIVPRKDRGSDHPANLITLCRRCHKQTFRLDYGGVPGMNVEQTTIVPKEG